MRQPKFILTGDGTLRLGLVGLHRELLLPHEQCYGGGFYDVDTVRMRLLLCGESYDYGPPQWHLFDDLHLDAAYSGLQIVYDPGSGDVCEVSALHHIIYD